MPDQCGRIPAADDRQRRSPLLDGLGSVRLVTDAAGVPQRTLRYTPFGELSEERALTLDDVERDLGFAGEVWSAVDQTIFLRARTYQPTSGRFLQRDSVGGFASRPQSLNRYAYAENNPVRYTDPSGHWIESALDIASIGASLSDIQQHGLTWTSGLALGADVVSLALPGMAAGGTVVRGLAHGNDSMAEHRVRARPACPPTLRRNAWPYQYCRSLRGIAQQRGGDTRSAPTHCAALSSAPGIAVHG